MGLHSSNGLRCFNLKFRKFPRKPEHVHVAAVSLIVHFTSLPVPSASACICLSHCQLLITSFSLLLQKTVYKKAVLPQGKPRDAAAVLFGLKFADNVQYKFKSSQSSKARFQSSKYIGTKQNLTQNGHSRSFKVTCFGVSGKEMRLSNTKY